MKEKISLSCFLLLSIFLASLNCLQTKIDLFNFGKVQEFKESKTEDELSNKNVSSKKVNTVMNREIHKKRRIHKSKEVKETKKLNNLLNILIDKYEKLKSKDTNYHKPNINYKTNNEKSIFNIIRFKQYDDQPNNHEEYNSGVMKNNKDSARDEGNHPPNHSNMNDSPRKESLFSQGQNKEIIPFFPLHMITKSPKLMPDSYKKDVFISKSLIQKLKFNRQWGLQTAIRSVPIQECNVYWDYGLHGDNWSCLCEIGRSQSPINIRKSETKPINTNVFFDLKSPNQCGKDRENSTCKFPLIKNTGIGLSLEYLCGYLVLPENGYGYKCDKISFHTPSEHKIDGKHYDLELQIFFESDPSKREKIKNTNVVVVVLFQGIDDSMLNSDRKYSKFRNNFLESLELDRLPQNKGEARLLENIPDFGELFNLKKQPDQNEIEMILKRKNKKGEGFTVKEIETYKKANHNKDKISQNPNKYSDLKERQKLHYNKFSRQYQDKIISKMKAQIKRRKINFVRRNSNGYDNDENSFDFDGSFPRNSTYSDGDEDEDDDEDNQFNLGKKKSFRNKRFKGKRKIIGRRDDRLMRIRKYRDYSGVFNVSNRSKEEPWNGHKHNDTNISEDLDNIIERNIDNKLNQDNDMFESNNQKSLFSTSFLKIDDQISYSNNNVYPQRNQGNQMSYKTNNFSKKSYYEYNPRYPLTEYYTYTGSETTPPCEEKHTYIVYGKPVYARLSQIIKISSLISSSVFKLGNNRNVQKKEKRTVYYFNQKVVMKPKKNSLEKAMKLNFNDFSTFINKKLMDN